MINEPWDLTGTPILTILYNNVSFEPVTRHPKM